MFKKFVAWVKALFVPVVIKEESVDEFINAQRRVHTEPVTRKVVVPKPKVEEPVTPVVKPAVQKAPVTPPKPLNEQLKGVELPTYAKGKTLPPKAKRQFIKQAKMSGSPAPCRRLDDTPHSTGGHVVSHGIDPVNAALYGYTAATPLNDDTPAAQPAPVEECRSSTAPSTFSSSYGSSSSSYDSSSYDSGSSYSSCD